MSDQPNSIFQDLEDLEKDKRLFFLWHRVKIARNILAVLCFLSTLAFIYLAASAYVDYFQLGVTIIYIACYFLGKKKPYICLLVATIVYIIMFPLFVYTTYFNPVEGTFALPGAGVILGLILRIVVIIYFIRGTIAAKKYEELNRQQI